MTYFVYALESKHHPMSYVGCSKNLKIRWRTHRTSAIAATTPLYATMRKVGRDNFSMTTISEHETLEDALRAEMAEIVRRALTSAGVFNRRICPHVLFEAVVAAIGGEGLFPGDAYRFTGDRTDLDYFRQLKKDRAKARRKAKGENDA